MNLAENLVKCRKERNISQKTLAKVSGVSQQAISYIESGKRSPSERTIRLLANALGVQASDLFGEIEKADASTNADLDTAIFLLNFLTPESLKEAMSYLSFLAHKAAADKK